MFKRKIYSKMLNWKQESDGKTALLIEGARRIGKSTVVEEFAKKEYESWMASATGEFEGVGVTFTEDDNGNYVGGARLLLSGTLLRKLMSEGKPVPKEFSKPEVIAVLKEYYDNLEKKEKIELHSKADPNIKKP